MIMFASNKEERERKKEKQRTNGRTKPQLKTNDVTMIRIGVNKTVKTLSNCRHGEGDNK